MSLNRGAAYGWRSHYTLVLLLFVYVMSFVDRQIMGILMEPIKREFNVSDTAMGLLSGLAFALFYTTLSVPAARFADRANRRNFIAYACAAWSGMTALCGMATGYWTLALARAGVAVGEAGGHSPSMSMLADHYPPEKRGRAMGVYWLGPQLGILVGLTLGGWIAQHYGWRMAFLALGLPGVFLAVMLRFTGTEPLRGRYDSAQANAAPVESLRKVFAYLLGSKAFVRLMLGGLLMGFAGYGIGMWMPAFLVRTHGMSLQMAGAVMGLLGGSMAALGALLSGWLCDTLSKRDPRWRLGVPALGCLLAMPAGLAFFAAPAGDVWVVAGMEVPKVISYYMVFALTSVWWTAPSFTVLTELVPVTMRATSMAVFNLGLTLVGAGLGPLLIGMASDALTPMFGGEALRWSLLGSTVVCFTFGILAFFWSIGAYHRERITDAA